MIKTNTLITFALAVTTSAMIVGILGAIVHVNSVFASQEAYSSGQRDAIRDYQGLCQPLVQNLRNYVCNSAHYDAQSLPM